MNLDGINPVWSLCKISLRNGLIHVEANLETTVRRETGLQFFSELRPFPGLGRHVITLCFWEIDNVPVL